MPPNGPVDLKGTINYASFKDRNVLLTGGASGLGKALVYMFAEHGANIVVADMQDGPSKQIEQELIERNIKAKFVRTDVTSFESQVALLREALAFFPGNEIDIYIPVAGILGARTQIDPQDPANLTDFEELPADISPRVIDINLRAVYTGTMLVARYGLGLHKAPDGRSKSAKSIVLMTSLAGYSGAEGCAEYTASKWGVRGLMRALRKQLAGMGVRINVVAPFFVETPMTKDRVTGLKEAGVPLATTEQVTEAVARLATDETAYGRSVFVMPDGLFDGGDDSAGGQGGRAFSAEVLGDHWAVFVSGALSDEVAA